MDKDSYGQISEYFGIGKGKVNPSTCIAHGIPSVEQLITNRHDRFVNRYRCQENYMYVCQALIM